MKFRGPTSATSAPGRYREWTWGCPKDATATWRHFLRRKAWDKKSCPREVHVGPTGLVIRGEVPEGDLLAIHTGGLLHS